MMHRSAAYLAFVRKNVCCAPSCMAPAVHAHHFAKRHGGGGTGCKPHDTYTVPLCVAHHGLIHEMGAFQGWDALETEQHFFRVALRTVTEYLIHLANAEEQKTRGHS